MNRILTLSAVATCSVVLGGCVGHAVHRTVQPPIPVVAQATADPIDILPARALTLSELLVPSANAEEPDLSAPECDLALQAMAEDPELDSLSPHVSTKEYSYTEVRAGKKKSYREPEMNIALRIIDRITCEREIVTITKRGSTLIAPNGWTIQAFTRENGIQWNDWATQFEIQKPADKVVIRTRWPRVTGTGKNRKVDYLSYVAYVRDLHLPSLVNAGRTHVMDLASQSLSVLRDLRVPSRAMPGMLLADTPIAVPKLSAQLGVIEHMDFGEFVLDQQWSAQHALIRIGANGDNFGTFTCSKAAACGLMQFTDNSARDAKGHLLPGTYTYLRKMYPEAHLVADFTAGARDQLNSMIASYLHHDDALRNLIERYGIGIVDNKARLFELVGAIYNAGAGRTLESYDRAVAKKATDWIAALPPCKRARQPKCAPPEMVGYVTKQRFVDSIWNTPKMALTTLSSDR